MQISIQQAELITEDKFVDQNSLSISDLQINYLSLNHLVRNTEGETFAQSIFSHCGSSHPTEKRFKQQLR